MASKNHNGLVQLARDIVRGNVYLTLATSLQDMPWASPVYYVVDGAWDFFFVSHRDSQHARNMRQNPKVAWAVFDSGNAPEKRNGVQFEGQAFQVGLVEMPHAISAFFGRSTSDWLKARVPDVLNPESYLSTTHYRFFKLTVDKAFILSTTQTHDDIRVMIDIRNLEAPVA